MIRKVDWQGKIEEFKRSGKTKHGYLRSICKS